MFAVDEGASSSILGRIYVSSNSGLTWGVRAFPRRWISVACSADGTKIIAAAYGGTSGELVTSTDSGTTWTSRFGSGHWTCASSSADGNKLAAALNPGPIYLSALASTVGTSGYVFGEQNSAIELQYVGNGRFIVLSQAGNITPN